MWLRGGSAGVSGVTVLANVVVVMVEISSANSNTSGRILAQNITTIKAYNVKISRSNT
jgi:hypothetical protein